MESFTYTANSSRILFGAGRIGELPEEVRRLKRSRAFVITSPQQAASGNLVAQLLKDLCGTVFPGAAMHTPVEVTEDALQVLHKYKCDCLISFGGGSATGLGKALALRTGCPQIAVPTTYAGSEVTPVLGETSEGAKTTRRLPEILPQVVIYDVKETLLLPLGLTASSGMNAIAHAVEALYARDANPIVSLMAEEGIRALARSLPVIMEDPGNLVSRTDAQYGAWLCGTCLGSVSMGLHHKLCHILGGAFDLPHAETHSIILPHVVAYNSDAAREAMSRLSNALGGTEPATLLYLLLGKLRLPVGLKDVGMPREGINEVVKQVCRDSYPNPRPIEEGPIRRLLENAYDGIAPEFF